MAGFFGASDSVGVCVRETDRKMLPAYFKIGMEIFLDADFSPFAPPPFGLQSE